MTLIVILFFIIIVTVLLLAFNGTASDISPRGKTRNSIDKEYCELLRETEKLRELNREWTDEYSKLHAHVTIASNCEKSKDYERAIDEYKLAISVGETSTKLGLSNYSHYIGRLIILYGKTKRFEELELFLIEITTKYKDDRDCTDWQARLVKLKNKKNTKTQPK